MSKNVYDHFAEGEVKAFATRQGVKPRKFAGRLLRKTFPLLASSVMMFSSSCAGNKENIDKDGFIDCTELTSDQITDLILNPNPENLIWDLDYNHAPENQKNYVNMINQGLAVIKDLSTNENLSEKEILDYKKMAINMLVGVKVVDGKLSNADLSDPNTLKSFLFFEKVVKYKDNYDKVFSEEEGIYNEQSKLLGKDYKDCYNLIEKAKNNRGILFFSEALYMDGDRFLVPQEDKEMANKISCFILDDWLKRNGINEENLFKYLDASGDNKSNTVSFYLKKGKDFRVEVSIDPEGDLGNGYYSPVGVNIIHELMHVAQKKPSSEQNLSEKEHLIEELGPTLNSLMLDDMIYKTIHKIPMDNIVNYGDLDIGRNKTSLGELAVWFRKMTEKYANRSIDGVLCENEVFDKLEKIGKGEKVNLLPQVRAVTKSMER